MPDKRKVMMLECLSIDINNTLNANKTLDLSTQILLDWYWRSCALSTLYILHLGYFKWSFCFLIFIIQPLAVSLLAHLAMNTFNPNLVSFLALCIGIQWIIQSRQSTLIFSSSGYYFTNAICSIVVKRECWIRDVIILPEHVMVLSPNTVSPVDIALYASIYWISIFLANRFILQLRISVVLNGRCKLSWRVHMCRCEAEIRCIS